MEPIIVHIHDVRHHQDYPLECNRGETVSSLKMRISKTTGLGERQIYLVYGGRILSDFMTLRGCNIESGSSLNCIIRDHSENEHGPSSRGRPTPAASGGPKPSTTPSNLPPGFLSSTKRDSKSVAEDDSSLSEDEVTRRIHKWRLQANEGHYNPDTHIVDTAAHYAFLDYLERDVVQHSEYFRCSGEYDTHDDDYVQFPELLGRYGEDRDMIRDSVWAMAEERLRNLGCPDRYAASLKKSYTIFCHTIAMLQHLRSWQFSTGFYSLLARDKQLDVPRVNNPDPPDVARLVPISMEALRSLEADMVDAVDHLASRECTLEGAAGILRDGSSSRRPQAQARLHMLSALHLTIPNDNVTEFPATLELLRMTILVLDLALVSYVGSHGSFFPSQYAGESGGDGVIRIPSKSTTLRSICLIRQSTACLDGFFTDTRLWLFEPETSGATAARRRASAASPKLKILAQIDVFADVWGPAWAVSSRGGSHDAVAQYNLLRGCIRRVPDGESPIDEAVLCHWHRSATIPKSQPLENNLQKGDKLLIGALEPDPNCPYYLDDFERDRHGRLGNLGTAAARFELDAIGYGTSMGQYLTLQVSATRKKKPEMSLKESLYKSFNENPGGANINGLNRYLGVEISHHTGNARRIRLRDLFLVATVDRRLDSDWKDAPWAEGFIQALGDGKFRDVWNAEAPWYDPKV
ncbi:hypothetical protein B0J18DRAFT_212055 [Chaetomium sp. MPI-SDFR-AT-0129]|nr:hypothetical protein B0J18DRAFT_212055 [Chaetomium sp. MPI-SDFR-AT-0129]